MYTTNDVHDTSKSNSKYGLPLHTVLEELTLQGKTAVQSSTGWGGTADRAIDGNTNSNFSAGSCMHTLWEVNPWWRVDLGAIYEVYRVKLYNGLDGGNHFKLSNFEIRIGKKEFYLLFPGDNQSIFRIKLFGRLCFSA